MPIRRGDAEAGRGSPCHKEDNQKEGAQLEEAKTTGKQSVLNLFHAGQFYRQRKSYKKADIQDNKIEYKFSENNYFFVFFFVILQDGPTFNF